jgi:hypothetical protein
MTLCSLIYASRRVSAEPSDILESIHAAAERNNALLGLTGALVFDHRGFVQLLEGCRANVTEMFLRIAQDPRHEDFRLLGVRDTPKRLFPQWSMHHAAIRGSGPVSARAFMPHAEFEPSNLGTDGAMALFEEVAHLARVAENGTA